MTTVPSPADIAINLLLWLGMPMLVLAPLLIVLSIIEWMTAAKASLRAVSAAERRFASLRERVTWIRIAVLIIAGALVAASSFSLIRFYVILFASDEPLTRGAEFQWQDLWIALTTYGNAGELPINAGLIALGWVIAVNLMAAVRSQTAFRMLAFVGTAAGVVVGVTAVLWSLYVPMVWLLAATGESGYNLDMLAVYGTGAGLSWILAIAIWRTNRNLAKSLPRDSRVTAVF